MKVIGCIDGTNGARDSIVYALGKRLGATFQLRSAPVPVDTDLCLSWRFKQAPDLEAAIRKGMVFVALDLGYFDATKFHSFSISVNGIHGLSMPVDMGITPTRPHPVIQPWREGGEFVQIISPGWVRDGIRTAASDLPPGWLRITTEQAIAAFGKPVKIRHHPRKLPPGEPAPVPLADSFEETYVSITYSSNTAIQTLLGGVPTIVQHPRQPAYWYAEQAMVRYCGLHREHMARDLAFRDYDMTDRDELDSACRYIQEAYAQAKWEPPLQDALGNYGIRP